MRGRLLALMVKRKGLGSGIHLSLFLFLSLFHGLAPDRTLPDIILWVTWLMMFVQTTNQNEIRPAERRESGGEAATLYVFSLPFPSSLSSYLLLFTANRPSRSLDVKVVKAFESALALLSAT